MPQTVNVPRLPLNTGATIPQLGFGVFQVEPGSATVAAIGHALDAGYRSIDTAAAYRNEESVGAAIAASGLPRDELFVTTKLWNSDQGFERALAAFDRSLSRLALEYVDLYLIHWPVPSAELYVDAWKALEQIHADGRARAVGVSNFQIAHLQRLLDEADVVPAVNQIELHPLLPQAELREFHRAHGILTEAWSPLAQGGALLDDPLLVRLAEKHGKTPAQVVLRWHIQLGNVVIPKSVTPARIAANGAHRRQHRRLRLPPHRRRHGRNRHAGRGSPHRAQPGHVQRGRPQRLRTAPPQGGYTACSPPE